MIIITSGRTYIDIDALACSIGYSELLTLRGIDHKVVLPQTLNHSITPLVRELNWEINTEIPNDLSNAEYIITDVSEPSHFAAFVELEKVKEVYDHHFGFEEYWKGREGVKAVIEPVGSCTTLVWEEYKKYGLENEVSELVANLFAITTLSHTLNFKSSVTTQRDINAFEELISKANLPEGWVERYFREIEDVLLREPLLSMKNDTKEIEISGKIFVIAQMELWDSRVFIDENISEIESFLESFSSKYVFLTAPSISEGWNHIVVYDEEMKEILEEILDIEFDGIFGRTKKLYLRKEIVRGLQKHLL